MEPAPGSLRAIWGRYDRISRALVALAVLAALLPIWIPRYLPLFDLPNHLATPFIWRHLSDPAYGFAKFYRLHLTLAPYWGHPFFCYLLSWVTSVEIANKLYLTGYVVATPLGLAFLADRCGRDPRLGLLGFPFLFNYCFKWGWVNFLGGVPLFFFALVALLDFLDEPTRRRGAMLAVCALAAYFTHILPWAIFGLVALVVLLLSLRRWRRALVAGLLLAPSLGIAVLNQLLARGTGQSNSVVRTGDVVFKFEAKAWSLKMLPTRLSTMTDSTLEYWAGAVVGLAFALLVVWSARPRWASDATPSKLRRWLPELVCVILLGLYFYLPIRILQPIRWWGINFRVVPIFAMVAMLIPRGSLDGWRRLPLVAATLAFVVHAAWMLAQFVEFNRRAAGFEVVMKNVPKGKSVLYQVLERGDERRLFLAESFSLMSGYAQMKTGGYNPFLFELGFPIEVIPTGRLPAPPWSNTFDRFDPVLHGQTYDYVLTYAEPAAGHLYKSRNARHLPSVISESNGWRLYGKPPQP